MGNIETIKRDLEFLEKRYGKNGEYCGKFEQGYIHCLKEVIEIFEYNKQ
jgi:hypothetical protein